MDFAVHFVTFHCLILSTLNSFFSESVVLDSSMPHRERRQLLFPNSTLLQFNAGVATPTPIKTIFVNWAFQANFQLPWNRSQIPLDIFQANSEYTGLSRKRRDAYGKLSDTRETENYENDASLYHFYKYVEDVLNSFGHNGTSCVLRALCHLAAEPLHVDDDEDLLHELATFAFNPENVRAEGASGDSEIAPYVDAFKSGTDAEQCFTKYNNCKMSLVDLFTRLHDAS